MRHFLEFEKPIAELEGKIEELRRTTDAGGIDVAEEVGRLRDKAESLLRQTYAKLSPWQKTLVARRNGRRRSTTSAP
jgi:acetyl-CoA carboxylase carboxyl transferase subunit alpha